MFVTILPRDGDFDNEASFHESVRDIDCDRFEGRIFTVAGPNGGLHIQPAASTRVREYRYQNGEVRLSLSNYYYGHVGPSTSNGFIIEE